VVGFEKNADVEVDGADALPVPELEDAEEVLEADVAVGASVASAPMPVSAMVSVRDGVTSTAFAADRNSSKSSCESGLIAPTIPFMQWDAGSSTSQKYQIGWESSVIVKFHTGGELVLSLPTPDNPLLNPPSIGVHGLSNVDCVTL